MLLKDDIDTGDPGRGIKGEPFSDDNMENKTKPVEAKRTAVQDAGHTIKEKTVRNGELHIIILIT